MKSRGGSSASRARSSCRAKARRKQKPIPARLRMVGELHGKVVPPQAQTSIQAVTPGSISASAEEIDRARFSRFTGIRFSAQATMRKAMIPTGRLM